MLFDLEDMPAVMLLLAGFIFSIYKKKLTLSAAFSGLFCGSILYCSAGYTGLLLLTVFFSLGTAATSWGRRQKQSMDKPGDSVQRKSSQVFANAGAATLMGLLILLFPVWRSYFMVMLAASLASATADTLSSELGMLYGKRFYNCITWKKEERGLDGVISLEGTLIGVAGAAIMGFIFIAGNDHSYSSATAHLAIIILSGAAGNFSDSLFGASLERKHLLNNDWVNFLSTLFAAVVALVIILIYSGF